MIGLGAVVELDVNNWEKEIAKSSKLTLVYFWHEQCPWCLRLNPLFDEISSEYTETVKFAKLNVLANPANQEIATNLGIMSTPTLVFFCSGRPIGQIVGLLPKEDLKKAIEEMLQRHRTCIAQSTDLRNYIV